MTNFQSRFSPQLCVVHAYCRAMRPLGKISSRSSPKKLNVFVYRTLSVVQKVGFERCFHPGGVRSQGIYITVHTSTALEPIDPPARPPLRTSPLHRVVLLQSRLAAADRTATVTAGPRRIPEAAAAGVVTRVPRARPGPVVLQAVRRWPPQVWATTMDAL